MKNKLKQTKSVNEWNICLYAMGSTNKQMLNGKANTNTHDHWIIKNPLYPTKECTEFSLFQFYIFFIVERRINTKSVSEL